MTPALRVAFVLGAAVCVAVALTGTIIYYNHPGDLFFLLGQDELQHRQFAQLLLNGGTSGSLFANALEGEAITGDATWGTGFVIALCTWLFGTDLSYMAVKCLLHLIATACLYRLIARYRGERIAGYVAFFFLIYPPLLVYECSFLKDDLVASLVVIASALIERRRWIFSVALMLLLVIIRANAAVFPVIFVAYLWRARVWKLVLFASIPIGGALLFIPADFFVRLANIFYLPPLTVVFYTIKFLVGPLPTNILDYDTEAVIIFPWYVLTFVGILAGFLFPEFYASVRRNWLWILATLAVSLAPYLPYVRDADVIGPRQFSTVGWFYLLLFYEYLMARYGFTLGLPVRKEPAWSAAT